MATRYFKSIDQHSVCTTSSGNRSKVKPGVPANIFCEWVEIERAEFVYLRKKIERGTVDGSRRCKCYVEVQQ